MLVNVKMKMTLKIQNKLNIKFFFFLIILLLGCVKKEDNDDYNQIVDDFLNPPKVIDSSMVEHWQKNSYDLLALETFFGYFFRHFDHSFSLDEDLVIMPVGGGNTEYFMYSKKEKINKIWSSICGVYEVLSPDQSFKLDSLEKNMKMESQKNFQNKYSMYSVFLWKGKKYESLLLKDRFVYFMNSDIPLTQTKMYNYFVKEVFVHGCKRHLLHAF